jgi:hypothetical protein
MINKILTKLKSVFTNDKNNNKNSNKEISYKHMPYSTHHTYIIFFYGSKAIRVNLQTAAIKEKGCNKYVILQGYLESSDYSNLNRNTNEFSLKAEYHSFLSEEKLTKKLEKPINNLNTLITKAIGLKESNKIDKESLERAVIGMYLRAKMDLA